MIEQFEPVDYCERLGDGFWAEPLNAVTNAAFVGAALLAARDLRRLPGRSPWDLISLAAVLAVIGVGSFLFHTLHTGWAALADTVPIALFMLGYVVTLGHRFAGLPWRYAALAAPAFVLIAVLVRAAGPALPVPGLYLPVLLVLAAATAALATARHPARGSFAVVTGLFTLSLTLRQIDQPLCPVWPWGTHFGWHLLNAAVLYLLLRAATQTLTRSGQSGFS